MENNITIFQPTKAVDTISGVENASIEITIGNDFRAAR